MKKRDKSAKQRYKKAASILDGAFIVLFVADLLLKKHDFWNSALYLTVVSLIFAVISGYVAYFHSRLPKSQREKPNWISASDFGTHPYFTFSLFCIFSVIGLVYLLI